MEITIQEIQNKLESLPENLKSAIAATKIDEKITEIGKLNGLNIEEMGQLSLETYMVILDYTHPDKFEESLKGSLNLPDEKNKNIVAEVNNKILKEIREHLMSLSEKESVQTPLDTIDTNANIENKSLPEIKREEPIKENEAKELENKKIMESISAQKLAGSFKAGIVKTEYSLNNISKDKEKGEMKEDPYRLKPE